MAGGSTMSGALLKAIGAGIAVGLVTLAATWAVVAARPSGTGAILVIGGIFLLATLIAAYAITRRTGRRVATAVGVVLGEALLVTAVLVIDNRAASFPSAAVQGETLGYSLVLALTLIAVGGGAAAAIGALTARSR